MPVNYVTETPFQLFNSAEGDILILNSWLEDKKIPDDWKNDQICNHATQAVEKMLKGFIIHIDIINAVKTVYSFTLLQTMREVFSKQTDYRLLSNISFTKKPNDNCINTSEDEATT